MENRTKESFITIRTQVLRLLTYFESDMGFRLTFLLVEHLVSIYRLENQVKSLRIFLRAFEI
jgi:hypothetical protein